MTIIKAAPLVWINGFPASGKLTVASLLPTLSDQILVLDNHKMIDPVEARISRDHPNYNKERQLYRSNTFDQFIYNASTLSTIVVFTGIRNSGVRYKASVTGQAHIF